MNAPRTRLFFPALIALAACSHAPKAPPEPESTGWRFKALELKHFCLGRAMAPERALPAGASADERKTIVFENYYEAFLDVKGQLEYVSCLERDDSADAKKRLAEGRKWLDDAQKRAAEAMLEFPPEKRIADVAETFVDVDAKRGLRRVVVTQKDGTRSTFERGFDKAPPAQ